MPDKKVTIFGGEPAAVVGALQALIVILSAVWLHWTSDQVGAVGLVIVVVGDVAVAVATHASLLGVVIGLIKAVSVALAAFGFHLDPTVTAALIAFSTSALGLFQRTQTSAVGYLPAATPVVGVPVPPHPVE